MILHGDLDKACKAGEVFDLIHKNDNFRLANWIFNAQALQHEVRMFARELTVRYKVDNIETSTFSFIRVSVMLVTPISAGKSIDMTYNIISKWCIHRLCPFVMEANYCCVFLLPLKV